MNDVTQTAALNNLIGETYFLRYAGKTHYGVVKVASARRVVVHFDSGRHVYTPAEFYYAATRGC